MFCEWSKTRLGQRDIKLMPGDEGWIGYITKEVDGGNIKCCDYANAYVPKSSRQFWPVGVVLLYGDARCSFCWPSVKLWLILLKQLLNYIESSYSVEQKNHSSKNLLMELMPLKLRMFFHQIKRISVHECVDMNVKYALKRCEWACERYSVTARIMAQRWSFNQYWSLELNWWYQLHLELLLGKVLLRDLPTAN